MAKPLKHDKPLIAVSYRISERHKFAMLLIARQRGVSIATALEQMAEQAAATLDLGPGNWLTLWDEEQSVRCLNLFALPGYQPDNAERMLLPFLFAHEQFFWTDKTRKVPNRPAAIILWPHLEQMEKLWRTTRDQDYWAAAKTMADMLRKSKLKPPAFG